MTHIIGFDHEQVMMLSSERAKVGVELETMPSAEFILLLITGTREALEFIADQKPCEVSLRLRGVRERRSGSLDCRFAHREPHC